MTQEEAKNTYTNSLGMKFLPVPGTKVLFCIHETRQGDYAAYAVEVTDLNDHWRRNRGPFEDDHPVSFINLQEAQRFCAWLSRKEGKTYRLPTDREWSLAAIMDEKAPLTHETLQAGPLNPTHYPWNGHFPRGLQTATMRARSGLNQRLVIIRKPS